MEDDGGLTLIWVPLIAASAVVAVIIGAGVAIVLALSTAFQTRWTKPDL